MARRPSYIAEDDFHRIQTPTESALSTEPATGNATVEDNLVESILVALYLIEPTLRRHVRVSISDHVVTLTGTVESMEQRRAIETAVKAIDGVYGISDLTEIIPAASQTPAPTPDTSIKKVRRRPMIYVTRYCSTDPASITAAIRQGAETLDAFLRHFGRPLPDETIVIYRNWHQDTVIVEIGYPAIAGTAKWATGEVMSGQAPSGDMISELPGDGVEGVIVARRRLLEEARLAGLSPTGIVWQRFPQRAEHLHRDYPAVAVFLQVSRERASPRSA